MCTEKVQSIYLDNTRAVEIEEIPPDKTASFQSLLNEQILIPLNQSPENRLAYLRHIHETGRWQAGQMGRISPKLEAQIILQSLGIGDPDTIVMPSDRTEQIEGIVQSYIGQGRSPVWIGSCIANDMADPLAPPNKREHAELWDRITTPERLDEVLDQIVAYSESHPELVVKIFPQDLKNLSIGRMLITQDGIVIQTKIKQLNGRDQTEPEKTIVTINITEEGNQVYVSSDHQGYARQILSALGINGIDPLGRLSYRIGRKYPDISILNPEFMLDLKPGNASAIAFYTDVVTGTDPRDKEDNSRFLRSSLKLLQQAATADKILPYDPPPSIKSIEVNEIKKPEPTIAEILNELRLYSSDPTHTEAYRHFHNRQGD